MSPFFSLCAACFSSRRASFSIFTTRAIASMRSRRTMPTSSMMIASEADMTFVGRRPSMASATLGAKSKPKAEWIVDPPMFWAATPVGAQSSTSFPIAISRDTALLMAKDLPVPPSPVRKTFAPAAMRSTARCCPLVSISPTSILSYRIVLYYLTVYHANKEAAGYCVWANRWPLLKLESSAPRLRSSHIRRRDGRSCTPHRDGPSWSRRDG